MPLIQGGVGIEEFHCKTTNMRMIDYIREFFATLI